MSQEHPTVWTDPHKKFRGVNMQAVKVMFKSHPIHHPPEEIPKPVFREDPTVVWHREQQARLKTVLADNVAKKKEVEEKEAQRKSELKRRKHPKQKMSDNWAKKYLRRFHKDKRWPVPTEEEFATFIAKHPNGRL